MSGDADLKIEDLYREFADRLHAWFRIRVHRHPVLESEVQDLLQDVWFRLLHRKPDSPAVRSPRAFLFQVARNTLSDATKACRTGNPYVSAIQEEVLMTYPASVTSVGTLIARKSAENEEVVRTLQCIERVLTPRELELFRLRHLEGLGHASIAKRLEMTLGSVKVAHSRIRKKIRESCPEIRNLFP
ncbi:MAG: RNA polymerase sigma factor [Planctomycetes bacterium]|nr:RNA polymerase sigma factor [Planctomycetota bacterium]